MPRTFDKASIEKRMTAVSLGRPARKVTSQTRWVSGKTGRVANAAQPTRRGISNKRRAGKLANFGTDVLYSPDIVDMDYWQGPVFEAEVGGEDEKIKAAVAQIVDAVLPESLAVIEATAKSEVKHRIWLAKRRLNMNVARYVDLHMEAAEGALREKNFEGAGKMAQWAMQNASEGEARVIDKPDEGPAQSKVMIGIQLGGLPNLKELPVIDG